MISEETIREIERRRWRYVLGVRMRKSKEVKDKVLSQGGRYQQVFGKSKDSKSPSPLKVKEVSIGLKRYIVCLNEDQAAKDRADREAIVGSLREALKRGDKSLIGNKGYRRFIAGRGQRFVIDEQKVMQEARYDGKWVLTTNTNLSAKAAALKYKQLWMVESICKIRFCNYLRLKKLQIPNVEDGFNSFPSIVLLTIVSNFTVIACWQGLPNSLRP